MAWCENCTKDGLRKDDVEFCIDTRKVLCHGCYTLAHPGWMPPAEVVDLSDDSVPERPRIGYAISLSQDDGFRARVSYGSMAVQFHAPADDIKRLIGG